LEHLRLARYVYVALTWVRWSGKWVHLI